MDQPAQLVVHQFIKATFYRCNHDLDGVHAARSLQTCQELLLTAILDAPISLKLLGLSDLPDDQCDSDLIDELSFIPLILHYVLPARLQFLILHGSGIHMPHLHRESFDESDFGLADQS